ncbi:putative iron/ascorbate oxidoreductase [Cladophialophora carrionii]|uniref:Putative iron/ascorbate oxidoreductase n=1 Tax=Cladophialophora carrionii TaxID=86049 RepID=A0A1C1D0H5_9EURO|nr:putative iron/ascorbate oxidoreductase [Cladophialophora carrionii]
MADIIRLNSQGQTEVRTGLGWRRVLSPRSADATTAHLPVIDITDITHVDQARRRSVAKAICHAASNVGFFYVRGHGVPDEAVASIFAQSRRFFHDLTLDEKMEYDTERHTHYYGYYPIKLDEGIPAGAKLNEGINYGYEACCDPEVASEAVPADSSNGDNWWPSEERLPGYERQVKGYMTHMLRLSRSLLRMFALGLDLDEHAFDHLATKPYSILKMAHYPGRGKGQLSGTDAPSTIRPHTDYELLTILLQDEIPSLEVLSNTGHWIQAAPVPGTFVVNIGDSLSMLTNGLFVSTMHRVINVSERARYSVPFFLGANQDAELKALAKFVSAENPAKFQPIMSGEYIRRSLQAVYSKPHVEIIRDTIEVRG